MEFNNSDITKGNQSLPKNDFGFEKNEKYTPYSK